MYRTREHRAKEMYFSKTKVFNDIQGPQTEDMLKKRMFCNFLTLWIMKIRHCPGRCRDRRESVGGNQRRKTLTPNMKRHKGKVSKKRFHLGKLSQIWVGGVADSQTPPNHPANRLFWPEFHLSCSQISQKLWDGWVCSSIWENYPKKMLEGNKTAI